MLKGQHMFWLLVWGEIPTIQLGWPCVAHEEEPGEFSARHRYISALDLLCLLVMYLPISGSPWCRHFLILIPKPVKLFLFRSAQLIRKKIPVKVVVNPFFSPHVLSFVFLFLFFSSLLSSHKEVLCWFTPCCLFGLCVSGNNWLHLLGESFVV